MVTLYLQVWRADIRPLTAPTSLIIKHQEMTLNLTVSLTARLFIITPLFEDEKERTGKQEVD